MGISSQQVHGLIKRLKDRGEISRNQSGFTIKK
jgi:biotin operon repressor